MPCSTYIYSSPTGNDVSQIVYIAMVKMTYKTCPAMHTLADNNRNISEMIRHILGMYFLETL